MRCDADHHCPPPCQGHVHRPIDRPRFDPRPPEATDRFDHNRPRERDSNSPCLPIADEHIPGRLSFDLYLLRGNRQARAAYGVQCGQRQRCGHGRPAADDDHAQRAACVARDAPRATPSPRACSHVSSPDHAAVAQLATRLLQRGSLLDVRA